MFNRSMNRILFAADCLDLLNDPAALPELFIMRIHLVRRRGALLG